MGKDDQSERVAVSPGKGEGAHLGSQRRRHRIQEGLAAGGIEGREFQLLDGLGGLLPAPGKRVP
ncbi:hypothetical protein, partial [Thermogemmatispora tikiterensis]|uniref:hypothetical protein n=1 Tax=Thermogemmatispora tikiterensis TaxID=1825093 RepID=UPI001CB97832